MSDHPTTILLSVHKGASTFLTDSFAPAMERSFPGMRHVAVHQELLRGETLQTLTLPTTGIVATRVYPPQYDTIIEDPVPPGGRFADKKLLMLRRDPRDVAVSFYYSFAYSHQPPPRNNRRALKKFVTRREAIKDMDVRSGIRKFTAKPAIKQFLATVDFLRRYPQTCLTTYEELTLDFPAWMSTVQNYMGWTDAEADSVSAGLAQTVAPPEAEDPHKHKRRVTPGNWRETFDPQLRKLFERKLGDHLVQAGYEW